MENKSFNKVINMAKSIINIKDYFVINNELVFNLYDEIPIYKIEQLNYSLSQIKNFKNLFDSTFKINYKDNYKSIILKLRGKE